MSRINLSEKISKYFCWSDMLWLQRWHRFATVDDGITDGIKQNLIILASKADLIQDYFDAKLISHCAFRPVEYNKLIGGSEQSTHIFGEGLDFHIVNIPCDEVRERINSNKKLEEWKIRMEKNPNSNWVHTDIKESENGNRYFVP